MLTSKTTRNPFKHRHNQILRIKESIINTPTNPHKLLSNPFSFMYPTELDEVRSIVNTNSYVCDIVCNSFNCKVNDNYVNNYVNNVVISNQVYSLGFISSQVNGKYGSYNTKITASQFMYTKLPRFINLEKSYISRTSRTQTSLPPSIKTCFQLYDHLYFIVLTSSNIQFAMTLLTLRSVTSHHPYSQNDIIVPSYADTTTNFLVSPEFTQTSIPI